jgi:hypothetical protein
MVRTVAVGVSVACLLLDLGSVAPSAQASKLIPATLTFRCAGASLTCPFMDSPDRIQGDSGGVYIGQTPSRTTPQQGAYIDSFNELYFVLPPTVGRSAFFDFSNVTQPPVDSRRTFMALWSSRLQPPSLAGPRDANGNALANGLYSIAIGGTMAGEFKWNFYDTPNSADTYLWTIRFNPWRYPGTSPVSITRTGQSAWTIEAALDAIGQLQATTTSGKQTIYAEGFYKMPFQVTVSVP